MAPFLTGLAAGNLSTSQWQPDQIELGIWLWQEAGQPLPEFWHELVAQLRQAPAPAADPAIQAELQKTQKKLQPYRELEGYQAEKLRDLQAKVTDLQKQLDSARARSAAYEQDASLLTQLREEKQKCQDDLKQARSEHWSEVQRLKAKCQEETGKLTASLAQARQNSAEITQEHKQLTRQLAELEQERDQLSQQLTEAHQQLLSARALPAMGAEIFQQALIIDYPALGQTPTRRLIQLSELYSSLLHNQPHPALIEASNWSDLKAQNQEPSQILLLGLEQLLYDQASLPIASWLRTAGFRSEALLAGLDRQLHTPRL
jgi:DNA repair exonuclease SbcCD ATPase subunit